jgi:carboxymethylenebutenolidase
VEITAETIKTPEGVEGYLAYPKGQKSPAVLIHFEIFGVNNHIQDVCRRFAQAGYAALAPDYFFRLPERVKPYTEVKAAFGLAATLKDDQLMADAGSCIRYLKAQSFVEGDAIGSLGFCMGGRISALLAATYPKDIKAAVSFYGGGLAGGSMFPGQTLNPMNEAAKIQAPILLFYGGKDQHITSEHVAAFTGKLKELGKDFESKVYPDADHGFFCDERGSHNPTAAKDAWQRVLDFLGKNLKRTPAAVG